jgi:hypothetical protein
MGDGETVKLNCDSDECAHRTRPALSLSRRFDGAVYYCFRCGVYGRISTNSTPGHAKSILRRLNGSRHPVNTTGKLSLPVDFVNLVLMDSKSLQTSKVRSWIYQYELDDTDIVHYNIGYSALNDAIIFPIYYNINSKYELVAYLMRFKYSNSFNYNTKYKLITKKDYNNRIYYYINNKLNNKLNNKKLIITEDIISAIKVNKVTKCDTLALLTTSITHQIMAYLGQYDTVYIWLDYDQRIKVLNKISFLKSWGINAKAIKTIKDPKAVPMKKIKEVYKIL